MKDFPTPFSAQGAGLCTTALGGCCEEGSSAIRNEEIASLLGRTPAFSRLDRQTLEQMARSSHGRSWGDSIFHEGESGECLHVVAGELVKVFTASESGEEMLLATPSTTGHVRRVGAHRWRAALGVRSGPGADDAVWWPFEPPSSICSDDAPRLWRGFSDPSRPCFATRSAEHRTSSVLDLPGRVAKVLVELGEDRGESMAGGIGLSLGVTQSDFAAMVGGSRPTVNQIEHAFEELEYLVVRGRQIFLQRLDLDWGEVPAQDS
jgi:CRP/FNR family cyclic AMP-dependent transcriptional regulator